jgi:hypothetical protein
VKTKKRLRSFRVDAGGETPSSDRWDGSAFANHSTSTFSVDRSTGGASSSRARWDAETGGATATPMTDGAGGATPFTSRSRTAMWDATTGLLAPDGRTGDGGAGSGAGAGAPHSVAPPNEDDEADFDREYYQMEARASCSPLLVLLRVGGIAVVSVGVCVCVCACACVCVVGNPTLSSPPLLPAAFTGGGPCCGRYTQSVHW